MSLLNSASLCVTPNGYKAGTLYSVIPNTTLGDMTVVRATTATRVNSAGLIESMANNVPRLDYSNGTCPSILVEPQRTNLVFPSENFNVWNLYLSATLSINTTISPDGTQNADTLNFGNNFQSQVYSNQGNNTNTVQMASVYAKSSTGKKFRIKIANQSTGLDNFSNDFTTTTEWQRFNFGITNAISHIAICNELNGGSGTIQIWGAQLEASSYPTSYIPTTSAAVTRNADVISKTGISSLIGQTEGTLFAEISAQVSTDNNWFQILDGTSNNLVLIGLSANKIRAFIRFGATTVFDSNTFVLTNGVSYKAAIAYKNADIVFYINGVQIATSSSSFTITAPISYLAIGFLLSGPTDAAKYNSGAIFPTRLTNAELAQLTT